MNNCIYIVLYIMNKFLEADLLSQGVSICAGDSYVIAAEVRAGEAQQHQMRWAFPHVSVNRESYALGSLPVQGLMDGISL